MFYNDGKKRRIVQFSSGLRPINRKKTFVEKWIEKSMIFKIEMLIWLLLYIFCILYDLANLLQKCRILACLRKNLCYSVQT